MKRRGWYTAAVCLILLTGVAARIAWIGGMPAGLNQDEASIGYEAYALVHDGIDRNGQSWPVHLIAWGSGQNALYAYLLIPFIRLLGCTPLAVRLPMALIGCLSLAVVWLLIRSLLPSGYGRPLALLLFAVNPWHIMKSRWGLESNLFPDLVLYAAVFLYFGIKRGKRRYAALSAVLLGLSAYAYGTSYLYIPAVILAAFLLFLIPSVRAGSGREGKAAVLSVSPGRVLRGTVLYALAAFVIALPIAVFVVINALDLPAVHLGRVTIPRLDFNRFTAITSANGSFFANCRSNLAGSFRILLHQTDGMPLNAVSGYGIYYFFSLPFIVYGLAVSLAKRRGQLFDRIALANLIAAGAVCAMTQPNINRINALWLPLLYYMTVGIVSLAEDRRLFAAVIACCYILSFAAFTRSYAGGYQESIRRVDAEGIDRAVASLTAEDGDVYITDQINSAYIYYLFYGKINPRTYLAEREIPEKHVMFQKVTRIGRVHFQTKTTLEKGQTAVVLDGTDVSCEGGRAETERYGSFLVVRCR